MITINEIKTLAAQQLNELFNIMKDVKTIADGKALLKKMPELVTIEVNGDNIKDFDDDFNPALIEWFRVEFYKNLDYVYFYKKDGNITSVWFDVTNHGEIIIPDVTISAFCYPFKAEDIEED